MGNYRNKLIMLGYNVREISNTKGKVCAVVTKQTNGFKETLSKYELLKSDENYEFLVLAFIDDDEVLVAVLGNELDRECLLDNIAYLNSLSVVETTKGNFRVFTNSKDIDLIIAIACEKRLNVKL